MRSALRSEIRPTARRRCYLPVVNRIVVFLLPLLFALSGCAGPLDVYKVALDGSTRAYQVTDAAWSKLKGDELDACLVPPSLPSDSPSCVEGVITRWAPRSKAIRTLYARLTTAGFILEFLETNRKLGRPIDLAPLIRAMDAALVAGKTVQEVSP